MEILVEYFDHLLDVAPLLFDQEGLELGAVGTHARRAGRLVRVGLTMAGRL